MKKEDVPVSGYSFAIKLVNGNASALARICGCSPQAVHQWKKTGHIPADKAKVIARTFGVPRAKLNALFA